MSLASDWPARRLLAAAVAGVAAVTCLTACTKPIPEVTVLANRVVTRLDAATYCFDAATGHCHVATTHTASVRADGGSTILVDVPRAIADQYWIVAAYTVDSTGKTTTVDGAGSSLQHDTHSVRLTVPIVQNGGGYQLSIKSTNGRIATGEWDVNVSITGS